jgi:hypothetical protein
LAASGPSSSKRAAAIVAIDSPAISAPASAARRRSRSIVVSFLGGMEVIARFLAHRRFAPIAA